MKTTVLYLVLILCFIDCSKDRNLKSGDLSSNNYLLLNEPKEISLNKLHINEDNNLSIKMDSVLTDSPCPSGAQCYWEGAAAIRFDFTLNNKYTKFNLYTLSNLTWHKDTTTISG